MEWKHNVSLDWMLARQQYLTASEVKQLIPFTATGKPRKITMETYMKIYAKKLAKLDQDDCVSSGAAARGHLLEPYAIESFNKLVGADLKHWDDVLVTTPYHVLAYSPDSLDVDCPKDTVEASDVMPTVMGEVKSYGADKHLECAMKMKGELEERWQIAAAMCVSPSIEKAYLILYNPDVDNSEAQLLAHEYSRVDLAEEMKVILEVEQNWLAFIRSDIAPITKSFSATIHGPSSTRIEKIEKDIMHSYAINPM